MRQNTSLTIVIHDFTESGRVLGSYSLNGWSLTVEMRGLEGARSGSGTLSIRRVAATWRGDVNRVAGRAIMIKLDAMERVKNVMRGR